MRVLGIPFVILGVLAATGSTSSDEPSEAAMRAAFETRLTAQVSSVLDFVAETGGDEALEKIRAARTDEFAIRRFKKLDCGRSAARPGYVCTFAVQVGVVSGVLEETMTGRFVEGPRGLVFAHEDSVPTAT